MTCFTTFQANAQNNLSNLLRAVSQTKWATAYAEEMALKASLINTKIEINSLIINAHNFLWGAYTSSIKDEPIHKIIEKVKKMSQKDIETQLAIFNMVNSKDLIAPVEQLGIAPPADKRAVLRAAQVVTAPVAAAYLGITTRALSKFTDDHFRVIGDSYAGGYCLSIDEVFLIEQNPRWLVGATSPNKAFDREHANETVFDHLLYVSTDVACAFTNLSPFELSKSARQSEQSRRPYRLSDLEKIRLAKLAAAA
jgi:hypothetical protein